MEIYTEVIEPQGSIDSLPRVGPIGGELIARDYEGKSLVEFVLPDRFPGGPHVPFKASWWTVEPGEVTPEDVHDVQEMWFVGQGCGAMRLGDENIELRQGQAVYIPPSTPHLVQATGDVELSVFSVWW